MIVMVSMPPTASTPMVQATVAVPVHVTPAGTADDETNVVVAGMVSLNVALVVATGPQILHLNGIDQVPEIKTGVGVAAMLTARSAPPAGSTSTDVVVALFDGVGIRRWMKSRPPYSELSCRKPRPAMTLTTYVKFATAPLPNDARVGARHRSGATGTGRGPVQPVGQVIALNVVFGGVCWYKTASFTAFGPLLVIVSV